MNRRFARTVRPPLKGEVAAKRTEGLPNEEIRNLNLWFPISCSIRRQQPGAGSACRQQVAVGPADRQQVAPGTARRRNQPLQCMAADFVCCPAAASGSRPCRPAAGGSGHRPAAASGSRPCRPAASGTGHCPGRFALSPSEKQVVYAKRSEGAFPQGLASERFLEQPFSRGAPRPSSRSGCGAPAQAPPPTGGSPPHPDDRRSAHARAPGR